MKLARDGTYGDSELKLTAVLVDGLIHPRWMERQARFIRRGGASKTARVWEEPIFHV